MSKHTPSPWSVSKGAKTNEHGAKYVTIDRLINGSGVEGLAVVYEGFLTDGGGEAEMIANAQLISCAPEMLEMLQFIYASVDWSSEAWNNDEGQKHKSELEQLIKKATL